MPLTAIIKSTQERIVVFENLERAKQHRDELICPICDEPLIPVRDHFRQGQSVQAFARHKDTTGHYETSYRYHTESRAHLSAKAYLAENAGELFNLSVTSYEFEVRLPEVQRIADVRLLLADGDYVIVEAQLSPITPEELAERTNDYERLGYTVCWCLGEHAYKDYNYRWCLDHTGICGVLGFEEKPITLSSPLPQRAAA